MWFDMGVNNKFGETNQVILKSNGEKFNKTQMNKLTKSTVDGKVNEPGLASVCKSDQNKDECGKINSLIHSVNSRGSLIQGPSFTNLNNNTNHLETFRKPPKQEPNPEGYSLAISEYISVNRESSPTCSMSLKTIKQLHKRRLEERGYRMTNKKLGEGGFGAVYKVYANTGSTPLACKIMILSKENKSRKDKSSMLQAFSNEVFVMKSCPHTNIVAIHKNFVYSHGPSTHDVRMIHSYIVMEYATNGTLYAKLKKHGPFTEMASQTYFEQISNALVHLHQRGIAHRDLKLGNILLTRNGPYDELVKLTDFGLSRLVNSQKSGLTRFSKPAGTLSYMSPELVACYVQYNTDQKTHIRPYDCFTTDTWALGVCLFLLLSKVHPFGSPPSDKTERVEFAKQMLVKQRNKDWHLPDLVRQNISQTGISLLDRLMEPNYRKRFNIYQVLAHHWCPTTIVSNSFAN